MRLYSVAREVESINDAARTPGVGQVLLVLQTSWRPFTRRPADAQRLELLLMLVVGDKVS